MNGADAARRTGAFRRRLEAMGLHCREVPGGHSLLVRLRAAGGPLPTPAGDVPVKHFVFSTVGANRIKCLVPRPLFYLPLIGVAHCETPAALEERIRQAWDERARSLAETREWLEKLGCEVEPPDETPLVATRIAVHPEPAELTAYQPGEVVLPATGLLPEIPLSRPEDRLLQTDADIEAAIDLELAVSGRADALMHMQARSEREARLSAMAVAPGSRPELAPRRRRVLLVGRRLLGDTGLIESLRLRGYEVLAVRGAHDALRAFERGSFELVLAESELDRFEAVEMVPSVRELAGVEEVPVVVVDHRLRPELRDTARRVGAAGYVTHPIDVPLIETGLARLMDAPRRRRFTRYDRRLGVRAVGCARPEMAAEIGRGGMLLRTERRLEDGALQRFAVALPDGAGPIRVDGEVVYRLRDEEGGTRPRVGIRFERFPDDDEHRLIAFLQGLERSRKAR